MIFFGGLDAVNTLGGKFALYVSIPLKLLLFNLRRSNILGYCEQSFFFRALPVSEKSSITTVYTVYTAYHGQRTVRSS